MEKRFTVVLLTKVVDKQLDSVTFLYVQEFIRYRCDRWHHIAQRFKSYHRIRLIVNSQGVSEMPPKKKEKKEEKKEEKKKEQPQM